MCLNYGFGVTEIKKSFTNLLKNGWVTGAYNMSEPIELTVSKQRGRLYRVKYVPSYASGIPLGFVYINIRLPLHEPKLILINVFI